MLDKLISEAEMFVGFLNIGIVAYYIKFVTRVFVKNEDTANKAFVLAVIVLSTIAWVTG